MLKRSTSWSPVALFTTKYQSCLSGRCEKEQCFRRVGFSVTKPANLNAFEGKFCAGVPRHRRRQFSFFLMLLYCSLARRGAPGFLFLPVIRRRPERSVTSTDDDEEDDDDDSPIARSDTDHEEGREGRRYRQKTPWLVRPARTMRMTDPVETLRRKL